MKSSLEIYITSFYTYIAWYKPIKPDFYISVVICGDSSDSHRLVAQLYTERHRVLAQHYKDCHRKTISLLFVLTIH